MALTTLAEKPGGGLRNIGPEQKIVINFYQPPRVFALAPDIMRS
jgi:hypothetical protein